MVGAAAGCAGRVAPEPSASERLHAPAVAAPVPAATQAPVPASASSPVAVLPPTLEQAIPGAAYKLLLRLIPASADGSIKAFYIGVTEVTWDAADTFIFALDEERGVPVPGGADAITRPTKSYLPPDRGLGHEGYPAITMSFEQAKAFCAWLSAHAGRRFRLPTEAEWAHACRAGEPDTPMTDAALGEIAWFAGNSSAKPHPVGRKRANAFGLHDMLGNVQEWCVAPDATGVTRGGSYRDAPAKANATHREPDNPAWNASDPQEPKSTWWLADGTFVGFRVVCEVD